MLDARTAPAPEFLLQEKCQSGDRKLRKRIGSFKEDRSLTNDTVLHCADLFTTTLRNDDVQEFDTRWDAILLSMTESHLMMNCKVCTNEENTEYGSLINSKLYWNGIIRNIDVRHSIN